MSLTVDAYTLNSDGKMEGLFPPTIQFWREPGFKDLTREQQLQRWRECNPNPGKDMAGPESYREELWGSEAVCTLGCVLLPTLREKNIYAVGEQIDQLAQEVNFIRVNSALISQQTRCEEDRLEHYLTNIMDAIERARSIGGGVVIW